MTKNFKRFVSMFIVMGFALMCCVPLYVGAESTSISEGYYMIKSAMCDKYICVSDNVLELGTKGTNIEKQFLFYFQKRNNNYFTISSAVDGKVVQQDNSEFVLSNFTGNDNQLFEMKSGSKNSVSLVNIETSDVFDIRYGATGDGTDIIPYAYHGDENQRFILEKVSENDMRNSSSRTAKTKVTEGYYYIKSALGSDMYLAAGQNNLEIRKKGSSNDKKFIFYLQKDGKYFTIVSNLDNKIVQQGNNTYTLTSYTGNEDQLFSVKTFKNGNVAFLNKDNYHAFDVAYGDTKDGTKVNPYYYHGDENQRFILESVSGSNTNNNISSATWSLRPEKLETTTIPATGRLDNQTRFEFRTENGYQRVPYAGRKYLTRVYYMNESDVLKEIDDGDFENVASMKKFIKLSNNGKNKMIKKEYTTFDVSTYGDTIRITATLSYEYEVWSTQAELKLPNGYNSDDGYWEVKN